MTQLSYVPASELARLARLPLDAVAKTALFATCCRLNALYMVTRAGSGHLGSSFSSLDVVSWLLLNEIGPDDVYFSSKGHDVPGLYAVLQGLGRLPFDSIHTLRRLGGLPGHPDVATPGIEANTGPLGMGISKAKGMILANRLAGRRGSVFVLTGDGELQEGQLWESLGSAARLGMGELTAIVDHNKIQSDTWVERVADLGDLEAKFRAFGWYVARCAGHDLTAFSRLLGALRAITDRPKVVIADTVKGRGVSFMEAFGSDERLYRFHSGAPDDETYARAAAELIATANAQLAAAGAAPLALEHRGRPERPSVEGTQRMVAAYARALVRHGERRRDLVVLDADLALDCGLLSFEERFPERFVECGIAEQDMVSQAGGLALRGMLPVVHSFACFLSTRPNEQIYSNATERTKVIYVASLAGVLPGGPGHSHQAVRDVSALAAVPGLVMLEPSCEAEVALALEWCVEQATGSCYLRLATVPCRVPYVLPADYRLTPGQGVALTAGGDAVLIGYGPVLLPEACLAADELRARHGVGLRVVNLPWLNRVDDAWLAAAVRDVEHVFTLDDHYVHGGQGDMLAARLAELGLGRGVTRLGLTDVPACGQNDEVLRAHGLDAASLARTVRQTLERRSVA